LIDPHRLQAPLDEATEHVLSANEGNTASRSSNSYRFTENTRCIIYGLQHRACQGMLDFDFICKRKTPSVAVRPTLSVAIHFVVVGVGC